MGIHFGTDGWRAVIGDEFTFAGVRRFGDALTRLILERDWGGRGIVIGHDCRFMAEDYAGILAGICSSRGVRTISCAGPCPTPAVALAARTLGTALAAIVTASHNPYRYSGIKLRDETGAPAGAELTARLETMLSPGGALPTAPPQAPAAPVEQFDPYPGYLSHVARLVDLHAIEAVCSRAGAVVHDAMHGSAAGWLGRLVPGLETIRGVRDPLFGGLSPEPTLANLGGLRERIREADPPALGIATDGDGDRIAAIAEDGSYVDAHHLLALLFMHLVEDRGMRGPAVRTVTTSTLVDRLAGGYGLGVHITPVGFKHIAPLLKAGVSVIGGEESGGIGFAFHLPERDGVFAALMILEHLAMREITLVEAVERLRERAGRVWLGRVDIRVPAAAAEAIERGFSPPPSLAGEDVTGCERLDGIKLLLSGGSWLHVRASHTEPVLRLYAQAESPLLLQALLDAGRGLATAGGPSPPGATAPGPA